MRKSSIHATNTNAGSLILFNVLHQIIVLTIVFLGTYPIIFNNSFTPYYYTWVTGSLGAAVLTIITILIHLHLYRKGLFIPRMITEKRPKRTVRMVIFFVPLLLFGLYWSIFNITLPQFVTHLYGTEIIEERTAIVRYYYNRQQCDYHLVYTGTSDRIPSRCISRSQFFSLPSEEFLVLVTIKKSDLGYSVIQGESVKYKLID